MTFHVSPLMGGLFVISMLIGIWVYSTARSTPLEVGRLTGDLAAAITAAAAAFAVLCVVVTAPQEATQQRQQPAQHVPALR